MTLLVANASPARTSTSGSVSNPVGTSGASARLRAIENGLKLEIMAWPTKAVS